MYIYIHIYVCIYIYIYIYRGLNFLKREAKTVSRFKGVLGKKERGGGNLMHTMNQECLRKVYC